MRRSNLHDTTLGRWKIDYDPYRTARKIDLSNEDHCGTCSRHTQESAYTEPTNSKSSTSSKSFTSSTNSKRDVDT